MQIVATKNGEGQVITKVDGNGKELLEMLAAVNASVASVMFEHEITENRVGETLGAMAALGLKMAVEEQRKQ